MDVSQVKDDKWLKERLEYALAAYLDRADPLTFERLAFQSAMRCEESFGPHLREWSLNDWLVAIGGELGEAMNIAKKLRRGYDLTTGKTPAQLKEQLADELADVVCYLDLCATSQGIDLSRAVTKKFNEVSARVKSERRL